MQNKKFWFYQLKSFLPLTIGYLFLLGIIKLLTILYYIPKSFFWDVIRFSLPFLVIWFFINSYQSAKRLKAIIKEQAIPASTPIEAQLLHTNKLQRRKSDHLIRSLRNHQQEQLDHVELYSHEIKNSLTSLQAAAENNDMVPSKVIRQAVQQANYHLEMLLNDERLAMSSNDFNFEWVNLEALIMTILKQNSSIFISRQLVPKLQHLNGISVLTDKKWLRFCINQLLANAVKYSPNGATIFFNWVDNSL